MDLNLHSVARALGGDVSGGQVLAPGPGHSEQDRSLAVCFNPRAPDGFLVHSFSGDDPLRAKDYVRERLRLPPGVEMKPPHAGQGCDARSAAARRAQALAIWAESRDPWATPVEAYLRRRGLDLPHSAAGTAIRYHPDCPFAGERTPAMVCLIRDIVTNAPKAIHRTALLLAGEKKSIRDHNRLSLGPIAGGAIKLTPDADVTTCLGIGEGLESTLSLQHVQEFGPSPVWCLLSSGGMWGFPILSGVECLWIAVDHDPAGVKAAKTCSARWRDAGCEVFLVKPRFENLDFNDILKRERRDAQS